MNDIEKGVKVVNHYLDWHKRHEKVSVKCADWTTYNGVICLRLGKDKFVAVPNTGRKDSNLFNCITCYSRRNI